MPIFRELFESHLKRPEVRAQFQALNKEIERQPHVERGAKASLPIISTAAAELPMLLRIGLLVATIIQRVQQSPPSDGYEPWLIEQGSNALAARSQAKWILHVGRRVESDRARSSAVIRAIKFLAKPHRNSKAVARKIKMLLAAWHETSVFDMIFAGTDCDIEFAERLEAVARGDERADGRLMEMAAQLAPHLPDPRGRKVSLASATHEVFLDFAVSEIDPSAYTWDPLDGDCTDAVTEATRREFRDPDFDPRPARRRFKRRHKSHLN